MLSGLPNIISKTLESATSKFCNNLANHNSKRLDIGYAKHIVLFYMNDKVLSKKIKGLSQQSWFKHTPL